MAPEGEGYECLYLGGEGCAAPARPGPAPRGPEGAGDLLVVGRSGEEPVGFTPRELTQNLLVAGIIGMGKTTLVKRLLLEASLRGAGFLVLDYEGEYRGLAGLTGARVVRGEGLSLALWRPPSGVGREEYIHGLVGALGDYIRGRGWDLTPAMARALREAVEHCVTRRASGPGCLVEALESPGSGLWRVQTSSAVLARIDVILSRSLESLTGERDDLEDALGSRIVVDLSRLAAASRLLARTVASLVLARLRPMVMMLRPGARGLGYLLVVEEADDLLRLHGLGDPPLASDLAHYRKRGVGIVLVTHGLAGLERRYLDYIGNYTLFRLPPGDAPLARSLLGDRLLEEELRLLPRGHAVLLRAESPVPVRAELLPPEPPEGLGDAERLLQSVLERPWLPSRERRALLGMDGKRYRRALRVLLERGLLREVTVYTGGPGRPPKLLAAPGMNPGPRHEYGVEEALRLLRWAGCRAWRGSSQGPDVEAECCGRRIAVEVETGSNLSREKIAGRTREWSLVIVVCVARRCLRSAARLLAGLPRVEVATLYRLRGAAWRLAHECSRG